MQTSKPKTPQENIAHRHNKNPQDINIRSIIIEIHKVAWILTKQCGDQVSIDCIMKYVDDAWIL